MNRPQKPSKNTARSFFDHLDELRVRLMKSIAAFVIAVFVFYPFSRDVLHLLVKPVGQLMFTSPSDAFMAHITLSLWGGLFLAFPVILYQVWQFVSSGLIEKEQRYILIFGPFSLILFLIGGLFAYFVVIPISLKFLLSFSSEAIVPMIEIKNYISFVGSFILCFGVIFELPLIIMFLTKIGIATPAFLVQKRRHAIILMLIVSAVLTPPDVISQLLMALPLIVLYEISIWVSKCTYQEGKYFNLHVF